MTETKTAKRNRGIIVCLLTLLMALSFAVPVFAATTGDFFFKSNNGSGVYLNTWTSGTPKEGDNIKLYGYTGDNSQKWRVYDQGTDGYYSLRCMSNTALAINRHSGNGNAILWTWANGKNDSNVNAYNSGQTYTFYLAAHRQYLISSGPDQGDQVKFGSASGNNHQWWRK